MTDDRTPPRRRIEATLTIGADSWEDFADALWNLSREIERDRCRDGVVSGGYSSGYTLTVDEDPTITHDSWYAALQDYLARSAPAAEKEE